MIAAIVDGGDTAGLMRYLVGPGRANEHTDPHLIAGDAAIMNKWGDYFSLSTAQAAEIAGIVDQPMTARGMKPQGKCRSFNKDTGKRETAYGPNHVWHCSLSLAPEEAGLSDNEWAAIAQDFMDRMDFTEASGKPACRWVAVHHGQSKNGGDHIHIVANIIREDGTKWSAWYDQKRASKAVNAIEHKYGLRVLESREHDRCARSDTAGALRQAQREGKPLTDRAQLETRVRAAATAAANEAEFISRVRELGVRIRPRFAHGRTDVVVGYSVGLHTKPGEKTQWFSGSSLARDLALSRLRDRWPDTATSASDAAAAWYDAWRGMPNQRAPRLDVPNRWDVYKRALSQVEDRLHQVPANDPVALADATQDVAGIFATLSTMDGLSRKDHAIFEKTARQLGHHAQLKQRTTKRNPVPGATYMFASLAISAGIPEHHELAQLVTFQAILKLADALADLYRQAQQTNTARMIQHDTAQAWDALNAQYDQAQFRAHEAFRDLAQAPVPLQQETMPQRPQPTTPTPHKPQADNGEEAVLRLEAGLYDEQKLAALTQQAAAIEKGGLGGAQQDYQAEVNRLVSLVAQVDEKAHEAQNASVLKRSKLTRQAQQLAEHNTATLHQQAPWTVQVTIPPTGGYQAQQAIEQATRQHYYQHKAVPELAKLREQISQQETYKAAHDQIRQADQLSRVSFITNTTAPVGAGKPTGRIKPRPRPDLTQHTQHRGRTT